MTNCPGFTEVTARPTSSTMPQYSCPIGVGAVVGWLYERAMNRRANAEMAKRFGVLLASGLIVGESLLGVITAGLIVASGKATPLALVGPEFAGKAEWIGMAMLAAVVVAIYRWVGRQSET